MKRQLTAIALTFTLTPLGVMAHGIAGDRFFPATLNIDDPAVADELTLPQIDVAKEREDDGSAPWTADNEFELSKRITKDFGMSLEGGYIHQQKINGNKAVNGWDNFGLSAKYQFYTDADSETIISAGVDWDIGDTGSNAVGAEHFSTYTPTLFFGKGFGDLPDSMDYMKPFAITGQLGLAVPDDNSVAGDPNSDDFTYGFTVQYSIPYLQQHVKDLGIPAPFNGMIPLVEVAFDKPLDRVADQQTTGTINPGFIWAGKTSQVGLEAIIPINHASGSGVGAEAQLHFYLDDLFPQSYGKPLIE